MGDYTSLASQKTSFTPFEAAEVTELFVSN